MPKLNASILLFSIYCKNESGRVPSTAQVDQSRIENLPSYLTGMVWSWYREGKHKTHIIFCVDRTCTGRFCCHLLRYGRLKIPVVIVSVGAALFL